MIELVKENEIRSNKKDNKRCRLCGTDYTRTQSNGPIWIMDRNIKGDWTGQFICYECQYEKDKICYKCGNNKYIDPLIRIAKHYDKEGYWTGKFVCRLCYSRASKIKKLDITKRTGRQSIGEIIVSKILNVPICSTYTDRWELPFKLMHKDYGIICVRTSTKKNGKWQFSTNRKIIPDTYFCLGFDEEWKKIEIVYIIPNEEWLSNITSLSISKNIRSRNIKRCAWFETDPSMYNNIYNSLELSSES